MVDDRCATALLTGSANRTILAVTRANHTASMHIHILIDPLRAWGWHQRLFETFRADGHEVHFRHLEEGRRRAPPVGYGLLEDLEALIARGAPLRYANRIVARDLPSPAPSERCDLLIDASGLRVVDDAAHIGVVYGGGDELALMAALCEGDAPWIALQDGAGRILMEAKPAIERPEALSRALEHVFSRVYTLCRAAPQLAARKESAAAPGGADAQRQARSSASFAAAGSALAARAIALRLQRMVKSAPRWRTGYRTVRDDRVIDRGRWPALDYTTLADDGQRFYADPFVVWRDGVCHLFVEDYPFATRKGVISYVTLDAEGRASAPRPALERPYHLSYPMIFERDGSFWMIPETSNARTIELYRADPFPDHWVLERTFAENLRASDMTLLDHGGKLWLLGTLAEDGGSTWDGLGVFFADDLFGEWRAHPANPLLIDASCARPAGMVVQTGAGLVRPVQDCRGRYGAALALARIDRLDEEGYSQTILSRLPPDPRWKAVGAHTLNESGGVEAVDWIG